MINQPSPSDMFTTSMSNYYMPNVPGAGNVNYTTPGISSTQIGYKSPYRDVSTTQPRSDLDYYMNRYTGDTAAYNDAMKRYYAEVGAGSRGFSGAKNRGGQIVADAINSGRTNYINAISPLIGQSTNIAMQNQQLPVNEAQNVYNTQVGQNTAQNAQNYNVWNAQLQASLQAGLANQKAREAEATNATQLATSAPASEIMRALLARYMGTSGFGSQGITPGTLASLYLGGSSAGGGNTGGGGQVWVPTW